MKRTAFAIAFLTVAAASQATIWGFAVPIMDGTQEVPPNGSSAYGTASFTVNDLTWNVAGSVNIWGLSPTQITGMHIHEAPVGVNGPVRFNLLTNQVAGSPFNAGTFWIYAFNGTLNLGSNANNQAFLTQMMNDNAYINAHTAQFPGGEIRGQVHCYGAVPEPATMAVLGLGILPLLRRARRK